MSGNETSADGNTTLATIATTLSTKAVEIVTTLVTAAADNATTILNNVTSTTTTTVLPNTTVTTTTPLPAPTASIMPSVLPTDGPVTSTTPIDDNTNPHWLAIFTLILFVSATALIAKIIVSRRKRRADLIPGTARWRPGGTGVSTGAVYAPMPNDPSAPRGGPNVTNGLDAGPGEARLDWERQFFDDDTTTSPPSRLHLDMSRFS